MTLTATFREITFTDNDLVNPDEFWDGYAEKPWLFHDHGFTIGVVFAAEFQDALDILADSGRIDNWRLSDIDQPDYPDDEGIDFLGNEGHPYDIQCLSYQLLPTPPKSFVALFKAIG